MLVTTVEASDSRNALAKSRKTPYANIGNRLLESHSIQQEIRPIKNNAKYAKNSLTITTPNMPKIAQ